MTPLVTLVILDGWGLAPPGPGNAVELAETPVFDRLWAQYPRTTLKASGEAVGLPQGQMGNSEVGHLTIGSGRVLFQDLMRVNAAIEDDSLFTNDALLGAFRRARGRGGSVHLLGLVSHGGVHSHIDHLRAVVNLAASENLSTKTWIHAFTDGRDVSPRSAATDLAEVPLDRVATVCGRYYAMDRDNRWDRTDRAYRAICVGEGDVARNPVAAVRESYDRGITDEFIEPVVIEGRPRLDPATDTAIFFNFRPDRARQLSQRLLEDGVDLTTMTRYRSDFPSPVVFEEQALPDGKSNKGRVQAYDGPIYVADAANYLMSKRPELGIKDRYELSEEQYIAAVDLLKGQREALTTRPFGGLSRRVLRSTAPPLRVQR